MLQIGDLGDVLLLLEIWCTFHHIVPFQPELVMTTPTYGNLAQKPVPNGS